MKLTQPKKLIKIKKLTIGEYNEYRRAVIDRDFGGHKLTIGVPATVDEYARMDYDRKKAIDEKVIHYIKLGFTAEELKKEANNF
jgi:hypothetical protein